MSFKLPILYSFPPFFTLQPVDSTRIKQLKEWKEIILNYCISTKTSIFSINEWPYWENKEINRKLSPDDIQLVINYLLNEHVCEYLDNSKSKVKVFWKTPLEWGDSIYKFVSDAGKMNTIFTLYELHSGMDTYNESFHGLDSSIIYSALLTLQSSNRVEIYKGNNATIDEYGIKFKPV